MIKDRRIKLRMTQRQVADQCGITDSAFAHIERELRLPSEAVAGLIIKALSFKGMHKAQFEAELLATRNQQKRERVRIRAESVTPIGGVEQLDADDLADDLANDQEFLEACCYLRKALSRRNQRKTVLSALKAWASEN
jgi:transcriptional regulator with XRE-family HTH domain